MHSGTYAKLSDMEKVLNYLDMSDTSGEGAISVLERLKYVQDAARIKNIYLKRVRRARSMKTLTQSNEWQ